MAIDISRHPEDLLAEQITTMNTNLPPLTRNEINIRRVTPFTPDRWGKPESKGDNVLPLFPSALYIQPIGFNSRDYAGFVVRKDLTFAGGDVTIQGKSDNFFKVYIDGVMVLEGLDYHTIYNATVNVPAGVHEIVVTSFETTGGAGLAFGLNDGTNVFQSDLTWPITEYTGQEDSFYTGEIFETTAEVDMKIAPSEAFGDFVEFRYPRVDVTKLFGQIDEDTNTTDVEVKYPTSQIQMLSGSINTFKDIYTTWYRFSHNGTGNYPANENELTSWTYDEDYDCIQSTINSASWLGFVSDDFASDYVFSTIISSNHSDDDQIGVCLAAFKQGDVDDREHTLNLIFSTGGNLSGQCALVYNYYQTDNRVIKVLNSYRPPVDPNNKWSRLPWASRYAHCYARRTGSVIKIWAKLDTFETHEGNSVYQNVNQTVEDVSILKESDLNKREYDYYEIDLAETLPIFNRPTRYGYAAASQPLARFWNIRRPNDNPEVTPELKQYFLDTFGFNMGDNGIDVENIGANKFKIAFDNVLYKGELTMLPY